MSQPQQDVLDGRFKTPFSAVIVGPSGCGKSTFVASLIRNQKQLVTEPFDYLYIFIGTRKQDNPLFAELESDRTLPHPVEIFELETLYDGQSLAQSKFKEDFMALIGKHNKAGQKGAVIFDDLMAELSECDLLVNLFSRVSSHQNVSIIHITQNLFYKGKRASDNVTIFRNTKLLVVFKSPMDNSVINLIARRINPGDRGTSKLVGMMREIMDRHRYVVINGDFNAPTSLRFRSDIFAQRPFVHQKIFTL